MHPSLRALLAAGLMTAGVAAQPVRGRLPLESFTAAQGLPNDSITAIQRDSRGFLWFATLDGLSRYDGARFINYAPEQGIPDRMVWSVTEDREHALWVGTSEGVARMMPYATRGPHLFARVPGVPVEGLDLLESGGAMWTTCGHDLCRSRDGRFEIDTSFRQAGGLDPGALAESPTGELWVATGNGVLRRTRQGHWTHIAVQPVRGVDGVGGVAFDVEGRAFIATGYGFVVYAPLPDDRDPRPLAERSGKSLLPGMQMRLPSPGEAVAVTVSNTPAIVCRAPIRARDGAIWQPCYSGLFRIENGRIDYYDGKDGLPIDITAVAEDAGGDIWLGSRGSGALRLAHAGATSWTLAHGLQNQRITSLFQLDDGSVCAVNRVGLSCFGNGAMRNGSLWTAQAPQGWGWNQIVARDAHGELWAAATGGIVHWPRIATVEDLSRLSPLATLTTLEGLDSDDVFRVWIDSKGGVWAGTFGRKFLSRRPPHAKRFTSYGTESGIRSAPTAFAEDRAGNVWVGLYGGGLVRVNGERFESVTRNVPSDLVRDLEVDSRGGLWIGTAAGVARIADPTADIGKLDVRRFTRADGLGSNSGYCIVELRDHRIAIGSQRGLDVLAPSGGDAVHVSMREGLASNEVTVAMVDRDGALWLGTINGLSRLTEIPQPRVLPPPRLRIDEVAIDGVPAPVAELGALAIRGVRIEYPRHSMGVRFSAPHYDPSRPLRFEYRLAEGTGWIDAGTQRSILFDRLPGGRGMLEIRAVAANGARSEAARVSFDVVPAVWRRRWFVALVLLLVILLAFLAHKARVARLVAVERVRTRAATDLHDDLGSSLSRISILSEVAKRTLDQGSAPILDEIAESARGLVDALGDSIWSIDPQLDDVRSLMQRVRQFAAAVFETQSIAIDVRVAPDVAMLHLEPEQRREAYLILKEALNNAAKHADARQVAVTAAAEGRTLRIRVDDDGKGFAPVGAERSEGGRGVPSMEQRARRAGGTLEIDSRPGSGTSVVIAMPI